MFHMFHILLKIQTRDFCGGPVVKNPPANAGDMGLIPDRETKIPPAKGQLSLWATTTEAHAPGTYAPKQEKSPK